MGKGSDEQGAWEYVDLKKTFDFVLNKSFGKFAWHAMHAVPKILVRIQSSVLKALDKSSCKASSTRLCL